jgi:NAD(P)-dependent dehydrogenase (short-subunit alcohol dehydrogenase family)
MTISLTGKRILITGATGAIGSAITFAAREAGAWVMGSYLQNETRAREMEATGILMARGDLSDRAQAGDLVKQALEQAGSLDGLVYSAGNTRDRTLLKMSDPEWDEVMRLHLDGLMACCRAALPGMQERRQGKIVAIGSQSGLTGRVGQVNYSAAKAATVGFIKALAREAGRFGVTANVVCPGFIESQMTRSAPPEAWERAKAASALGTISSVETVASFTAWLLSDLCSGVTGQVFQLDSRIL